MGVLGGFVLGTDKLGPAFIKTKAWQDIQISDKTAWQNIQQLWASGNYSAAITALQNAALQNKWNDASHINKLLDNIDDMKKVATDNQFKADAPVTSETAPSAPSTNKIWFQLI